MKHLFIPYELAVIAKEKGFDEQCMGLYSEKLGFRFTHDVTMDFNRSNSELESPLIAAPLYQQIVDWFREKHDIRISLNPAYLDYTFTYTTSQIEEPIYLCGGQYYEALTKAIEVAFKLI